MVTINISNKSFYLLVGIIAVLAIAGVAIAALGSIPNPGHAVSEMQACSEGETLVTNAAGVWECGDIGFGEWVDLSGAVSDGIIEGIASTDGIIIATSASNGAIEGYTDSVDASILRGKSKQSFESQNQVITMPVKKGDYWKIVFVSSTNNMIHWLPLS